MDHDQAIRVVMIAGMAIILPIAAYHRVKAHATGERLDRRQEGLFIMIALRLTGIAGMVGLLLYLVNPRWMAWSSMHVSVALRWAGVALGIAAGMLVVWTFRSLGKNLTDTVVTRREHTLVMRGPYRWVRHPLYLSVMLSVVANTLAAANWFILLTGALCFALIVARTRREEVFLLARFGDAYADYRRRTGWFFPRFRAS